MTPHSSLAKRITLTAVRYFTSRLQVRGVGRQECDLDVSGQVVHVFAHQTTAMGLQAVPDDQQRLFQVGLERFEEFDQILLLDTAFVKPVQAIRASHPDDARDVISVDVKMNDGRLSLGYPGAHARGAFADIV